MRFLTALLSTLLLLAGSVFALPLLPQAPAAATTGQAGTKASATESPNTGSDSSGSTAESGITITLDEVTPWVDEKGTLKVRGLIANSSDQPIENPTLTLGISTRDLDAETRIAAWKTDPSQHRIIADLDDNGPAARKQAKKGQDSKAKKKPVTAVDANFGDTIDAGASYEFTISVPAENLGLQTSSPVSSWGPRGLSVQLGDVTGLRASETGFTTWYPSPKFDPTKISILAPVILPGRSADGLIDPDQLDEAIADGGSLATVKGLLKHRELGLAVDPRVITSFEAAVAEPEADDGTDPTEEPSDNGTKEPTSAVAEPDVEGQGDADDSAKEKKAHEDQRKRLDDWYHDFLDEAGKHTVIALPYSDPDLTALGKSDLSKLSEFAQDQREVVKDAFPKAKTDIAWPIAGSADLTGLRELIQTGNTMTILDDAQQPSTDGIHEDGHSQLSTTPNGGSTIDTLITDSTLTDQSAASIASGHPASAISELVASTAAIQSEAPYRSRHLLLPLPRTAASAKWEATVAALSSAPWIDVTDVDDLIDADPTHRGILQSGADAPQIGTSALRSLAQTRATQSKFNSVFTDPEGADVRMDRELLGCTSAAWTLGGNANRCAEAAATESRKAMGRLYLKKGSSVLLVTGEKTTIPVTIVNDAPAEAKLKIRMKPRTPQLRSQTTETVTIPASETMRVDVPVEGLANADVPTTIEMVTADDVILPKHESLMVRVRADWENIGTAVIGLALAVVFVIGLIKTISRGRPKIPEQQLADAMARAHNDELEKR